MEQTRAARSGRVGRWLAAGLLAWGVIASPAAVASAAAAEIESGDSVYIGGKEGYGGTGLFPIWSENPPVGEPDYWAYCIEHDVAAETRTVGRVGDLGDFLGDNHFTDSAIPGRVLWVLAHSYPALSLEEFGAAAGVPGISRNDAIEATQYAIWRYTDLTWDAAWSWETPDSEAAYWYLVNGANANPGLTPAQLEVTASVTAPGAPQTAGSLVGPFLVRTNQPAVSATADPSSVRITDAAGEPIDADAVVDGQELYLDLREETAAGDATVRLSARGSSSTGKIVSVPAGAGGTPTSGNHAQTIILVTPRTTTTTASAEVAWAAQPTPDAPAIGTSLVDSADGDRVVGWKGGTVVDTIAYRNLTPGTRYTVSGELIRKSDGRPTGIVGTATFTPAEPDGTVDVRFSIPAGHAGETLVAFEKLFEGRGTGGEPIAEHADIDDAAQTVTVEDAPDAGTLDSDTSTGPGSDRSDRLATTGSSAPELLAPVALLAVIAGAATLLLAGRRRLRA